MKLKRHQFAEKYSSEVFNRRFLVHAKMGQGASIEVRDGALEAVVEALDAKTALKPLEPAIRISLGGQFYPCPQENVEKLTLSFEPLSPGSSRPLQTQDADFETSASSGTSTATEAAEHERMFATE